MAATAERTENKRDEGAEPRRLLGAGPRRWRWLALGVALMALGAVAVAAALGQVNQRSGVVTAARNLSAGHVLTQGDLQVVEIAGAERLAALPAGDVGALIGQTVQVPVSKSALIAPGDVGTAAEHPDADEAVVGASLAANQVPTSLQAGAQVVLVITASSSGERAAGEDSSGQDTGAEEGAAPSGTDTEPVPAQVQSVTPPGEGRGGQGTRVELIVDRADAEAVGRAASADALTVVEIGGGER